MTTQDKGNHVRVHLQRVPTMLVGPKPNGMSSSGVACFTVRETSPKVGSVLEGNTRAIAQNNFLRGSFPSCSCLEKLSPHYPRKKKGSFLHKYTTSIKDP